MILIVTHSKDLSADFVIRHLNSDNVAYIRLDTDLLGTEQHFFGFGSEAELHVDGVVYTAAEVGAIWARRFALSEPLERLDPNYRDFARREMSVVMDAFLEDSTARQINPYIADRLAGNRLIQSRRAQACGLSVPAMLVTQDASAARGFLADHPDCIVKALSFGRVVSARQGGEKVAYASKVPSGIDVSSVALCPTLFQQRIQGRHEWRITTVGNAIFAARTKLPIGHIDWKNVADGSRFDVASLPSCVAERLLELCSVSGIIYGAHDLIEDEEGQFFFLETNPAGQWGWLELSLGLPIGRAIADELENYASQS